jgi:dGTPase
MAAGMLASAARKQRMDWNRLLGLQRLNAPEYPDEKHRPAYTKDADRILFSQPFRRLANKTQVHPLYDNDHVHHRLIHSLEVASVGRSLGIGVGSWLSDERGEIAGEQVDTIAGLVQTACMAHDIGNPPFGHSGEDAIGCWFQEKFATGGGLFGDASPAQRAEFEAFEGNAQGFRILTRTEMYPNEGGMRLTFGALGAFTKYPVTALAGQRARAADAYIGLKKYGFFENDAENFRTIAEALGLPGEDLKTDTGEGAGRWWRRHPLAFLMEAADDICYNIMDLEDAYLAGDVDYGTVVALLSELAPASGKTYPDRDSDAVISRMRARAITNAIACCVEAFRNHYDAIMQGSFAVSLTEASRQAKVFQSIRTTARDRIFNAPRKTELEVYGRNVICRVLDGLLPLFGALRETEWQVDRLSPYHLKTIRALGLPLHGVSNSYDALHALTDFVSGMTDRYAVKVANMIGRH